MSKRNIGIIYFAFLKHATWQHIVLGQLKDLLHSNILEFSDLFISLTGIEIDISEAVEKISKLLNSHLANIHFSFNYENAYEYPGIKRLYEEGIKNPDKVYLYFHSKGMVFHDNNKRDVADIVLCDSLIKNWESIITILNCSPQINKVCYGASEEGFAWFNYFWVRGKYLIDCEVPQKTNIRHYYESYIGRNRINNKMPTYLDCYNIKQEKPFYSPEKVCELIGSDFQQLNSIE